MARPQLSNLKDRKCLPCEGGAKPLGPAQAAEYLKDLPGWTLLPDGKSIRTELKLKDFMTAVRRVNDIAAIAEAENHHPDLHIVSYKKLQIELSTHAIGGLSENDFILAAKINLLS